MAEPRPTVAVLTVSTSVAVEGAEDRSGPALVAAAEGAGADVVARATVPDEAEAIEAALRQWVRAEVDVVLSTGGTGLTPDDVTPEATRAVIERDAPGFAEALRADAVRHTPMGVLSRGVSGIAGRTLIVNLPGSPRAIDQSFGVLAPTLRHVRDLLAGRSEHGPRSG